MATVLCPRCGMQAGGGKGFWGWSKPFCTSCGWNVALAKEEKRSELKQLPVSLLLFVAFFGAIAYFSKREFSLFLMLFLLVVMAISAVGSWKKLRLLDASHLATASLSAAKAVEERANREREATYQRLQALPKPRPVRLKPVPRIISIAFPVSWILIAYFGFLIVRNGLVSPSMFADLVPLLIVGGIWSVIAVVVIRRARKDRRLLAEGNLAMATITSQCLTGGKHQRSKVEYEFKDAAGLRVHGEATDESFTLYEEMETPIFYNPANPTENVPLVSASCELKQF